MTKTTAIMLCVGAFFWGMILGPRLGSPHPRTTLDFITGPGVDIGTWSNNPHILNVALSGPEAQPGMDCMAISQAGHTIYAESKDNNILLPPEVTTVKINRVTATQRDAAAHWNTDSHGGFAYSNNPTPTPDRCKPDKNGTVWGSGVCPTIPPSPKPCPDDDVPPLKP